MFLEGFQTKIMQIFIIIMFFYLLFRKFRKYLKIAKSILVLYNICTVLTIFIYK